MLWKYRGRETDLSARGVIVGIVNPTPDSFSDGGDFLDSTAACDHGLKLLQEGASILDIGGESTRPDALPVSPDEEMSRVIPVIEALRSKTDAPISIDTSKAAVAQAAIDAGADIINDITALSGDPGMASVAASSGAGLILMHMQGTPQTMQNHPSYPQDDVVSSVAKYLSARRGVALGCGVDPHAIILDPGLGFGKTVAHNLALIRGLGFFTGLGAPVLVGHSRKSFLGKVAGGEDRRDESPDDRLAAGLAVTAMAREWGARLFRVHDVKPHLEVLRTTEALLGA